MYTAVMVGAILGWIMFFVFSLNAAFKFLDKFLKDNP